jgi:hypothetical protein
MGVFGNIAINQISWDPAYKGAKVDSSGTSFPGDPGAIYEYWA